MVAIKNVTIVMPDHYIPDGINVRKGTSETIGRLCVIGCELNEKELSELFGI